MHTQHIFNELELNRHYHHNYIFTAGAVGTGSEAYSSERSQKVSNAMNITANPVPNAYSSELFIEDEDEPGKENRGPNKRNKIGGNTLFCGSQHLDAPAVSAQSSSSGTSFDAVAFGDPNPSTVGVDIDAELQRINKKFKFRNVAPKEKKPNIKLKKLARRAISFEPLEAHRQTRKRASVTAKGNNPKTVDRNTGGQFDWDYVRKLERQVYAGICGGVTTKPSLSEPDVENDQFLQSVFASYIYDPTTTIGSPFLSV